MGEFLAWVFLVLLYIFIESRGVESENKYFIDFSDGKIEDGETGIEMGDSDGECDWQDSDF